MKKKTIVKKLMLIVAMVSILAGCREKETVQQMVQETQSGESMEQTTEFNSVEVEPEPESEPAPEPEPEPVFEEYDISLMAVGDNLMHMGIVYTGKMEDGTYDYSVLFDGIAEYLDVADIKIINQETILGGNELGFSGFPYFNSPTELADGIAEAGFNVVLQASNHSADQGISGLLNCVEVWEQYPEVLMTGIHTQADGTHEIPLLTIEDVTFAVLNYTYGPNMEVIPSEIQGHLDMLCNWDENSGRLDFTTIHPQVLADIEAAEQLADIVIVCPHWGTEYTMVPSRYQETFAQQMAEAGADLIIGTHPHVIQPVEWIETESGKRALCYYSLGNYVSTQKNPQSMLEAMAWVTFHVKEDGVVIDEEKTGALPMVCHYKSGPVRLKQVYLLEEYTEELAASHGILGYGGIRLKLSELQQWSEETLGEWILPIDVVHGQNKNEE